MSADVDVLDLIDPERYARGGYPHEVWTRLRAEDPVAYFAPEGYEPFWAITKHADILEISKQPLRFSSAQGITLRRAGAEVMPSEMVMVLKMIALPPAAFARAAAPMCGSENLLPGL